MDTLLYIISRIILLQFFIKVNIFYRNYGLLPDVKFQIIK